MDSWITMCKS